MLWDIQQCCTKSKLKNLILLVESKYDILNILQVKLNHEMLLLSRWPNCEVAEKTAYMVIHEVVFCCFEWSFVFGIHSNASYTFKNVWSSTCCIFWYILKYLPHKPQWTCEKQHKINAVSRVSLKLSVFNSFILLLGFWFEHEPVRLCSIKTVLGDTFDISVLTLGSSFSVWKKSKPFIFVLQYVLLDKASIA